MLDKRRLASAIQAAGIHLLLSLLTALLFAGLVLGVWYPFPYRELMGGRELFTLVIAVDVVCGPLLTLVLFNPAKPRPELKRDLGMVALIQILALSYGVYTVALVRPVYVVYEVDRFRVVSKADIPEGQLKPELGNFHQLPWYGPKLIGIREPKDADEKAKSLGLSLQGQEPSVRPDWWQNYDLSRAKVLARAKPVTDLRKKRPEANALIDHAIAQSGRAEADLRWLPITSFKSADWVAFIDSQSAEILAYAAIDGF
jgi:hypothetical protein